VEYILGNNPRNESYMVGFGSKYPQQPHHRAASIPCIAALPQRVGCGQGFTYFNSKNPNPNVATGAIIGGPDKYDNLNDTRGNYQAMEPTTYMNSPVIGILAVLATPAYSQYPIALQQFQDPMQNLLTTEPDAEL
jgi:endoglucanase